MYHSATMMMNMYMMNDMQMCRMFMCKKSNG